MIKQYSYTKKIREMALVCLVLLVVYIPWINKIMEPGGVPDDPVAVILLIILLSLTIVLPLIALYLFIILLRTKIFLYHDGVVVDEKINKYRFKYAEIFDVSFKINYVRQIVLTKIKLKSGKSIFMFFSTNDNHYDMVETIIDNMPDKNLYVFTYLTLSGEKFFSFLPTAVGLGTVILLLLDVLFIASSIGVGNFYLFILYLGVIGLSWTAWQYARWTNSIFKYTKGSITIIDDGIMYTRDNKTTTILWSEKPEVTAYKMGYARPMMITIKTRNKSITYVRFIRFFDTLTEHVMEKARFS